MARSFVLLMLLMPVSSLFADSRLVFPRVSFDATVTGIAIVNPADAEADVVLTAYESSGKLLEGSGITNPATVRIGAGRQFAQTTSVLFGRPPGAGRYGWCEARSVTDGLTGFFLVLNPALTSFDGADLPALSPESIFLEIRFGGGHRTEVNVVNPTAAATPVTFKLIGSAAGKPGTTKEHPVTIPANGLVRLDVEQIFGKPQAGLQYYLTAAASRPVAGFAVTSGPGDQLGSNAVSKNQRLSNLVFPQMAVLDPIATELSVVNSGVVPVILTITARQPNGKPYGSSALRENPVARSLPAGALLREDLAGLFGFRGKGPLDGWLDVQSTEDTINGSISYSIPAQKSWAAVASAPQGTTRAIFSHIATTLGYYTGLAMLNPGALAANFRVVAVKNDGKILGTYSAALQPGQRISKLITELIPESAGQGGGFVWVTSDLPLFMTSLFGRFDKGVLANVPPQFIPDGFEPDGQPSRLEVKPGLAVLQPSAKQAFQVTGGAGAGIWEVNGQTGGSPSTGTITGAGLFSAPAAIPTDLPVTISVRSGDQKSAASVDLINRQLVVGNRGLLLSVAYLKGLAKLYTAELAGSGSSGIRAAQTGPAAGSDSTIFDVTQEPVRSIVTFSGDEVSKMIPYTQGSREYLLVSAKTSGKVIAVDPVSKTRKEIASGLSAPTSLVLDPLTGDLLVAESNRVSVIPAATLQSRLAETEGGNISPSASSFPSTLYQGTPSGLSIDVCTGDLLISDRVRGEVVAVDRLFAESSTVVAGLDAPGQQQILFRDGVGCPQGTHLLVVEQDGGKVSLVFPASGTAAGWAQLSNVRDLAWSGSELFLAEQPSNSGRVSRIELPQLYSESRPPHIPVEPVWKSPQMLFDHGTATPSTVPASRLVDISLGVQHAANSLYDSPKVEFRRFLASSCVEGAEEHRFPLTLVDPPGFDFSACPNPPGSSSASNGILEATWEPFLLGMQCTVRFRVRIGASIPVGTHISVCGYWSVYYQLVEPGY